MKAELLTSKEIDAAKWDSLNAQSPYGSFALQFDYLSLFQDLWQAIIVRDDKNNYLAALPVNSKRKFGLRYSLQLPFIPYVGPIIAQSSPNSPKQSSFEKKMTAKISELLSSIFVYYEHYFHPSFKEIHDFKERGFDCRTRLTYKIDFQRKNLDEASYHKNHKRNLKSAKKNNLHIEDEVNFEKIKFLMSQEGNDDILSAYEKQQFQHIFDFLLGKGQLIAFSACKGDEIGATGLYAVYEGYITYIIGFQNKENPMKGAMHLAMHRALSYASERHLIFDFEGSMIPGVARFFRNFDAQAMSYPHIIKNKIPLLSLWKK